MLIRYRSKQMTVCEWVIEFTLIENSDLFKNQSESFTQPIRPGWVLFAIFLVGAKIHQLKANIVKKCK